MRRREFLGSFGWMATIWALPAQAQPGGNRKRIGVLIGRPENDAEGQAYKIVFQQALEHLGWRTGDNIFVDYRWMAGDPKLAEILSKELVALRPDVLVINSTAGVLAARVPAGTIPIVMVAVADPVAQGFVKSLERPGGTITGFAVEEPAMGAKWVELLKEIAPRVRHITAIYNPNTAPFAKFVLPSIQNVQTSLAFELAVSPVENDNDVERAIKTAGSKQNAGLAFLPDAFLGSRREMITSFVATQKLPAIYPSPAWVRSGGLIGYGFDRANLFGGAAAYVDRILKGEMPSQLPVQMPTKFELAINVKAAKALGLYVSPALLARADEVIE